MSEDALYSETLEALRIASRVYEGAANAMFSQRIGDEARYQNIEHAFAEAGRMNEVLQKTVDDALRRVRSFFYARGSDLLIKLVEEANADWLCSEALERLEHEQLTEAIVEAKDYGQDARWIFRYAVLSSAFPEDQEEREAR